MSYALIVFAKFGKCHTKQMNITKTSIIVFNKIFIMYKREIKTLKSKEMQMS